ncbi:hypothetical protein R1flu_024721 [Riccia fluitans]|uniref:Uncharacterized protein n=1 Tax=Riccia fluitans TaxID=41844 RepID=A0ABD1XVQ5_9MARC
MEQEETDQPETTYTTYTYVRSKAEIGFTTVLKLLKKYGPKALIKSSQKELEDQKQKVKELVEAEEARKEQVANACKILRTMAAKCFGDRMSEAELEELRSLKKYIKPCCELE